MSVGAKKSGKMYYSFSLHIPNFSCVIGVISVIPSEPLFFLKNFVYVIGVIKKPYTFLQLRKICVNSTNTMKTKKIRNGYLLKDLS